MITSRGEYEFVEIDGGIKVDGEIMPLRAEARKNDLRGEDPAFLMEAQGERYAALWGGSLAKERMTKEISGERLKGIVKGFLKDANIDGAEDWDCYFIREQIPGGDLYGLATKDVAKELGLRFTSADFSSKVWNFESGGVLRRSHMEALFADADRLRIPFVKCETPPAEFYSQIALSHSVAKGQTGLSAWEPDANAHNLYEYMAGYVRYGTDEAPELRGGWYEAVVNGGNLSYNLTETRSKWLKPVTRTLCLCHTRVQYRSGENDGESPDQDEESAVYDVFSCPSTQTGSVVTLNMASLVGGAKRFLAHYHFVKKQVPFHGEQSATVELAHVIPVCEMGDHTRWETETGGTA